MSIGIKIANAQRKIDTIRYLSGLIYNYLIKISTWSSQLYKGQRIGTLTQSLYVFAGARDKLNCTKDTITRQTVQDENNINWRKVGTLYKQRLSIMFQYSYQDC